MDQEMKRSVTKLARRAETKVAQSLLRWRYKKEGRALPGDDQLEAQSREIASRANEILARRGKRVWTQLKGVYFKEEGKREDSSG